jgi:hypothetical protein
MKILVESQFTSSATADVLALIPASVALMRYIQTQ